MRLKRFDYEKLEKLAQYTQSKIYTPLFEYVNAEARDDTGCHSSQGGSLTETGAPQFGPTGWVLESSVALAAQQVVATEPWWTYFRPRQQCWWGTPLSDLQYVVEQSLGLVVTTGFRENTSHFPIGCRKLSLYREIMAKTKRKVEFFFFKKSTKPLHTKMIHIKYWSNLTSTYWQLPAPCFFLT